MILTVNLVTRSRPGLAVLTAARTLSNIRHPDTRLMVSIDDDDEPTIEAFGKLASDQLIVNVKRREDDIGSKHNRVLERPSDLYCNLSDYTPFATEGFDLRIIEAASLFPDGIGVVVNHKRNDAFSDIFAATHRLVEKLGWYFPPYFAYWFVDHWLQDIAKLIDRIGFADVVIDYPPEGKPKTQELRDLAFWATFFDAAQLMRRRQARDIILSEDFADPPWRKQILLRNHPLLEYDSKRVNDHCRELAAHLETAMQADPPDERYRRIKAKATEMLRKLVAEMETAQE